MIKTNNANTRSLTTMTQDSSPDCQAQERSAKKAAFDIAASALQSKYSRKIVFKCCAIDKDVPAIQVATREALSCYLVKHNISNPGKLSDRERGLCAWTLLEHVARNGAGSQHISAEQVSSYINPVEKPRFQALAQSMNLRPEQFIR